MRATAAALLSVVTAGCFVEGRNGKPVSEPEFYAKNVQAYGESATGLPPDTAYAYDLRVAGDVARWRECTSADTCGSIERTRPAGDLLGVERVGEADVDGERVAVMKLSLAARPTYIVPNFKPPR